MSSENILETNLEEKITNSSTKTKRINSKPTLQIYRPPGLRNVSSIKKDDDIEIASNASSDSRSSSQSDHALMNKSNTENVFQTRKTQNYDNKKNISVYSQKTNNSLRKYLDDSVETEELVVNPNKPKELLIRPQFMKDSIGNKKKQFSAKEYAEIVSTFNKLDISTENHLIQQFITDLSNDDLASHLAQNLVQYSVEENKQNGRIIARLCGTILECPSGEAFYNGLVTSLMRYFDCREQLRNEHLKIWITFVNFISDLYANVGVNCEFGLVNIIFNLFDYMLKEPILDTLKIEELECLISALLSIGYNLERDCPDQLGLLKNQIRDAFVAANEPWARKMLLLLMELGASGWTLPADANEYYFQ